jgi:hypothetical protein
VLGEVERIFMRRPIVMKLVHMQGYDDRLVKMLVDGIASMYLMREWNHELLTQPDAQLRAFGVVVAAHVAHRWPMLHTEKMVKLAIETSVQLAQADDRPALRRIVPVLPIMARTFPRSGMHGAVAVAQQVVELLTLIKPDQQSCELATDAGGGEDSGAGIDAEVEAAMANVIESLVLLEGVAV